MYPKGEIVLPLTVEDGYLRKIVIMTFTVVYAPSSYNIILGRPAMNALLVVASIYHQKIKFSVWTRVGKAGETNHPPGIAMLRLSDEE